MSDIQLESIVKKFGDVTSVNNINLSIEDGRFVIFVGPSGCGKTTTLRMIGGLETPTSGQILFDGQLVNHVPPADRNVAMVFQNFALYPHMSAKENITLSLRIKKIKESEIQAKLDRVARMLNISHLLERKPGQLSGGEKQRVAVGRAIIRNPNVLLMDEPLSNLDAKLRLSMRAELKTLAKEIGVTTIYVTHDQVEAMTLGDTMVVMNKGCIQQTGHPMEIYNNPRNMFVAGMIGSPPINYFKGNIVMDNAAWKFICPHFEYGLEHWLNLEPFAASSVVLGIRPGNILPCPNPDSSTLSGSVDMFEQHGTEAFLHMSCGEQRFIVQTDPTSPIAENSVVSFTFSDQNVMLFDEKSEMRIGARVTQSLQTPFGNSLL